MTRSTIRNWHTFSITALNRVAKQRVIDIGNQRFPPHTRLHLLKFTSRYSCSSYLTDNHTNQSITNILQVVMKAKAQQVKWQVARC